MEGKIKGEMEVTRRRGRRRKKLLDDLKIHSSSFFSKISNEKITVCLMGHCVLWASASYGPVRLMGREIGKITPNNVQIYLTTGPNLSRICKVTPQVLPGFMSLYLFQTLANDNFFYVCKYNDLLQLLSCCPILTFTAGSF
jgi:hypothetical protein